MQVISEQKARDIVISLHSATSENLERFAIHSSTLSARGDYWVVRANSEDYVVRGMVEHCYVGVNAYLVHTESGDVEVVGSGGSVERYLEDKCDLFNAGTKCYVLMPIADASDKAFVLHLRQQLECSLVDARRLTSSEHKYWLTGKRSTLSHAKRLLEQRGILTKIELVPHPCAASTARESDWHWEALKASLNLRHSAT